MKLLALTGRAVLPAVLLVFAGCAGPRPGSETETGGSGGEATGGAPATGGSSGGQGGKGGAGPTELPPDKLDAHEPEPVVTPDAGPEPDTGAPVDSGGMAPAGVTPSPPCAGTAVMPAPSGNQTIMANGKNRTFILRPPTGYD